MGGLALIEIEFHNQQAMTLEDLPQGREAKIAGFSASFEAAQYLRAMGISEGVVVIVVRQASLGGPLFVRASSGAEIAIDRALARAIKVTL